MFLSSLSSSLSYGFTTDYSRLVVGDKILNIVTYAWNGSMYVFENLMTPEYRESLTILNLRIADNALTLYVESSSTESRTDSKYFGINTLSTYVYNAITNKY